MSYALLSFLCFSCYNTAKLRQLCKNSYCIAFDSSCMLLQCGTDLRFYFYMVLRQKVKIRIPIHNCFVSRKFLSSFHKSVCKYGGEVSGRMWPEPEYTSWSPDTPSHVAGCLFVIQATLYWDEGRDWTWPCCTSAGTVNNLFRNKIG